MADNLVNLTMLPPKKVGKYVQLHFVIEDTGTDVYFKLTQSKLDKHYKKYSQALGTTGKTVKEVKLELDNAMIERGQDNHDYCLAYTGTVRLRDYAEPHLNIFKLKPVWKLDNMD